MEMESINWETEISKRIYTLNVKLMGIAMNDFQTLPDKLCVVFDSVSQNQDAWELNWIVPWMYSEPELNM